MANFEQAIDPVLESEGYIQKYGKSGYVNDKSDAGGETIAGISRKNWPHEVIWLYVDSAKKRTGFPRSLAADLNVRAMILDFYRRNFWQPIHGDSVKQQVIADLLVDKSVLEGIAPAIARAEEIVGLARTGKVSENLITKLSLLA
ncbi:MAG: N-acetylmuramidase [Bacteroidetes bacterium]|nr:N-acetylmuramidase [Bacteroidota bacterium]